MHSSDPTHRAVRGNRVHLGLAPQPCTCTANLSEAERQKLHEASDHAPWHYTEFGVLCSCGLPIIDAARDYCQTMVNLEDVVAEIRDAVRDAEIDAEIDAERERS